jgi:NADPH:quinone reductase-like Zn-dependent oxidoreductase
MRVVGVEEFGGPERLRVFEVPEPHVRDGEVRIRVVAVAVNPTDVGVRSGLRDPQGAPPPYVPGMDAAGVVDEVGEGSPWRIGDRVMAMALPLSEHGGAYVEHLVGPWESMAPIPENADLVHAAALPMNGLTALQCLELLHLGPDDTLAVTGAAGTLGNYLVQLGEHAGLRVIADAAPKDRELVASLGPDEIVERGEDVADRIRALAPHGVDGLVDASVQRGQVVRAVRDGGGFVSVRGWAGEPERDVLFHRATVSRDYPHSQAKLETLRRFAEDGVLTLRVADVLPVEQAAEAHRRLEAGGVRGRIILTF